jgi:hypothetical protein
MANEKPTSTMTQNKTGQAKANLRVIYSGLAVCFLSALCFTLIGRTWQTFLSCGVAAILINLGVSLWYSLSRYSSANSQEVGGGRLVLVVALLTTAIPFAILYTLFAWIFAGFPLSF